MLSFDSPEGFIIFITNVVVFWFGKVNLNFRITQIYFNFSRHIDTFSQF